MNRWKNVGRLLLTFPLAASAVAASQSVDQGTIIVRQGGQEIGRESFRYLPSVSGADSLFITARYPDSKPLAILTAGHQRHPTAGVAFQLDFKSPQGVRQVYAATVRGRIAVRSVAPGSESAREYPDGPRVVILDDSLFALFLHPARLAKPSGEQLTAIYPRSGKRLAFTATGDPKSGGTRIVLTGGLSGTIDLDNQGRLMRVEFPAQEVEAIRLTDEGD